MVSKESVSVDVSAISASLRELFPRQPYVYFGVSGTTLLYDALCSEVRNDAVLPAYMCPFISAAVTRAGKRVVHIDADPDTQLPLLSSLERAISAHDAGRTIVLIDHSFGYPFPCIADLRKKYPGLLIVEDCARALGVLPDGERPGHFSDWVLLSMYKTTPGCEYGAVLMSASPLALRPAETRRVKLRERLAGVAALRSVYQFVQRYQASSASTAARVQEGIPEWTPAYGVPDALCLSRFAAALRETPQTADTRATIAEELVDSLCRAGIEAVRPIPGQRMTGHFASFRVRDPKRREYVLNTLKREGLFLGRTWDLIPARFEGFRHTFPCGTKNSEYLADHMLHIRMRLYPTTARRRRLVERLKAVAA